MTVAMREPTVALTPEQHDLYIERGFVVVDDIFSPEEVAALRRRADDIAAGRVEFPQGVTDGGRMTGVYHQGPGASLGIDPTALNHEPEIMLTDRHARRANRIYPVRQRPVDPSEVARAVEAMRAAGNPFYDVSGIDHLLDHDDFFSEYACHPNIVAVLRQLIGPNVKLFFDHLYHKAPFGGTNRFHQDGFFMFTSKTVTCWIALDDVTLENGPLHYIGETVPYGRFPLFDQLGDGITAEHLAHEMRVPLKAGSAAFHDRWTIHATGPNETPHGRRGWALHFTDAKSRFVKDALHDEAHQTSDGLHLNGDVIYGNRHYPLICGREFPGCV